ncbi:MAG: adenosylcobinamide-GDP ribazoletransferase [Sulfuricella sp.]|nr:adenosylcobinamide-GDP ribazoletransferase [Sulfuricella sp.]
MKRFLPFLIAVQFLTRFPVRLRAIPAERELGRSLLYYPLVGLLLGLLLAALGAALGNTGNLLGAAILLSAWVLVSGGLHLDGLADSADAWVGGLGDRERTLAIMKDPYCGPAAVVTLALVLLLKFAALTVLLERGDGSLLVLAPLLGRCALPALFLTTNYVRPGGLGDVLARHMPRRATYIVVLATLLAVPAALGMAAAWPLLAALAMFGGLRAGMIRRLGGTTGDTAGALVELLETAVLVTAALG